MLIKHGFCVPSIIHFSKTSSTFRLDLVVVSPFTSVPLLWLPAGSIHQVGHSLDQRVQTRQDSRLEWVLTRQDSPDQRGSRPGRTLQNRAGLHQVGISKLEGIDQVGLSRIERVQTRQGVGCTHLQVGLCCRKRETPVSATQGSICTETAAHQRGRGRAICFIKKETKTHRINNIINTSRLCTIGLSYFSTHLLLYPCCTVEPLMTSTHCASELSKINFKLLPTQLN